ALFIIEVPSFDTLINNHRFDQVFHQRVNYFSLSSMKKLIDLSGCEYIDHTFNYNFWGGTMLFAFKKSENRKKHLEDFNAFPRVVSNIKESYKIFKDLLENVLVIPSFSNVELDYKTKGEFSKYLVKIKIREHRNRKINIKSKKIGKEKMEICKWYAIFYFKQKPRWSRS
ncbi:hypothetical protein LCGC14_2839810, partial [marine sediment metagenome]